MQTRWFMGIAGDDLPNVTQAIKSSSIMREQLLKILEARYGEVERKGLREEDYETSDWTFKQAFNNGRLSILQELADLLHSVTKKD